MAEVYAGFLAHADEQIGRLLDYLEETGQRENTMVIVVSDNGASGEGGPNGSVNENNCSSTGSPTTSTENLAMLDELGGPKTYNHYPNGWAMAFNTPFKMWKRYEFNGGTSDPCIISWPEGIEAKGEIREQYHHAIDLVPTILDALGVEPPETIGGHAQSHFDGVSMRYSFDAAPLPSARETQFYSMLGSRSIWHDGWKAVTTHPTLSGWGNFDKDTWELYHTDVDRSELHDLAAEEPERLQRADQPLVRRGRRQRRLPARRPLRAGDHPHAAAACSRRRATATSTTPASPTCPSRRRSTSATAPTPSARSSTSRRAGAEGVLFAHGSRFGGHALYVKDNRLHYVYSFVGSLEQKIVADQDLPTGEDLILSAAFEKDGEDPPGVAVGTLSLFHGDVKVGEGRIRTQPGKFSLAGEGLCVGRDSGDPVTDDYPGAAPWRVHRRHDQPRRRRRQRRALRRPRARGRRDDVARVGPRGGGRRASACPGVSA